MERRRIDLSKVDLEGLHDLQIEALKRVQSSGVDSHTGVEDSSGRKSREKVQKFLSEAKEAFNLVKAKHLSATLKN